MSETNEELIARVYARWCGSGEEEARDILELCMRLEQAVSVPPLPEGMFTASSATVAYVGFSTFGDSEWTPT